MLGVGSPGTLLTLVASEVRRLSIVHERMEDSTV